MIRRRGLACTRPPQTSLTTRPKRQRYTHDEVNKIIEVSLDVGEIRGRRLATEAERWLAEGPNL